MPVANPTTSGTNQQVIDRSNMSLQDLSIALASPVQTPVPATDLQPNASTVSVPEPEAPQIQEAAFTGVTEDVTNARSTIDSTLNTQKADVDSRIADLKKEQNSILATGEELTEPFREKLENAERERLFINENFEANQKLVGELESLLTEGNELINISKGRAVSNTVLNKSVNKTISDVLGRAGVIQAVMSARNGQISVAENMIDRSVNAIAADRNDQIGFFNTLLTLNNNNLISLDKESKDIANKQLALAENDLAQAQKSADAIKELMVNPETAQLAADAGVTLNDDVKTIGKKIAKQQKVEQVKNARNELTQSGYDIVAAEGPDTISFDVGGQQVHAKIRPGSELDLKLQQQDAALQSTLLSNSIARINREIKNKELDLLNNPVAVEVSGLGLDESALKRIDDLTDGQRETIANARETVDEIDRMIALVESTSDISLLTKGTVEGREFQRLAKNVVDKLARERTGAVVGKDEEKTFKDIVGVGFFNLIAKDDTELLDGLRSMKVKHDEALFLNDPTGEVQNALNAGLLEAEDNEEINTVWGIDTSTTSPAFNAGGFFN